MNITIAGYGFVGLAHETVLKKSFKVNIYDPYKGYNNFGTPDGVIVCVSTPSAQDGSCDMSNVFDVLEVAPNVPILIKSTISIEGWQSIKQQFPKHKIAFSPEFLRAATAEEDFFNTRKIYIGGDEIGFWHALFRVAFNDANFTTQVAVAEELILAKYFRNSFLATKVSFFNQVYDLCTAMGADYNIVRHIVAEDARIGLSHTEVTAQRGYGGHCFPKDMSAIVHTAKLVDVDLSLIKGAENYNKTIRKPS